MNPIAHALSIAIVELLSSGHPVTIDGFGRFDVRRYRAYREGESPLSPIPYFVVDPALRPQIDAGNAPSGYTAPLLLERLSVVTTMAPPDAAKALDAYVTDLVRLVGEEPGRRVPFGRLGLLYVNIKTARTGEPNPPSRKVLSFVASVWFREQIKGGPEPATAPSATVKSTLDAFSTALATADQVIRAADLAGAKRSGANDQALKRIERKMGGGLPALLRTLVAEFDVRSLLKALPVELLNPDEYPEALAQHRRSMDDVQGIPFAREASGDLWFYCLEHGPEVWVFAAGPDEGAVHSHTMTLSAWLGGSLLVAALRRALGDGLLSIDDAQAVVARLHAIAPNAGLVFSDLPF